MLETFILLALIYIGDGEFEIVRRPDLTRSACHLQSLRIEDDRGARAWCFSDPDGPTESPWHDRVYRSPICAHGSGSCSWPLLPRHKRVEWKLAPHICGYAACWPVHGPGNALLPVREPR